MRILNFLTIVIYVFSNYLKAYDIDCYSIIKSLSSKDKCLSSRIYLKRENAKDAQSAIEFASSLKDYTSCNGNEYSCGNTRSWVTEIFEGLTYKNIQFIENKYDDGFVGEKAGYKMLIGNDLRLYFQNNSKSKDMFVYHVRHTGTHDHVWVIEQLKDNLGYRIYQSYSNAYSLKAWLATDLTGLYEDGELMIFESVQKQTNETLLKLSNGSLSLNNLDFLPENLKPLRPYLDFVKNYNKSQVISNFKTSWELYGKGKILSQTEFATYIDKLASLTEYFKLNDMTTNIFPQKIYDDWITLFASPDPTYYPNFPNNFLSSMLMPGRVYRFEVLEASFQEEPNCKDNAEKMHKIKGNRGNFLKKIFE